MRASVSAAARAQASCSPEPVHTYTRILAAQQVRQEHSGVIEAARHTHHQRSERGMGVIDSTWPTHLSRGYKLYIYAWDWGL